MKLIKTRARQELVFKLASLLLRYPDEELYQAAAELRSVAESMTGSAAGDSILAFLGWWDAHSLVELQQTYVETFDLHGSCSLYLTFFAHGDTRERGRELVELKRRYAAHGFLLEPGELPDFLPVVLEFAAFSPASDAAKLLIDYRAEFEAVRRTLASAGVQYHHLLDAVASVLPRMTTLHKDRIDRLLAEGPPTEMVGLKPYPLSTPGEVGR